MVAFHPERLRDVATFDHSGRYSEGVEYLLVNGVLSIDGGDYTGDRGGRALRHSSTPREGRDGSATRADDTGYEMARRW